MEAAARAGRRLGALRVHCAGKVEVKMGYDRDNGLKSSQLFSGFDGKVVLVTGGSIGIGRMIAEGFVRNGARVYVVSRKATVCAETAKELTALGPGVAYGFAADLSTEAGCTSVVNFVKERESKLHVLVNNAGATWGGSFDEYADKAWDRVFNLNVRGVFNLTKLATPLLESAASAADPARVINIGSVAGSMPASTDSPVAAYAYAPSKAAVNHMSRGLAKVLAPRYITVNVISPGFFATKMNSHLLEEDALEALAKMAPLKRIGSPSDISGTALFLCSKAGSFITGENIRVGGGVDIQ